MRDGDGNKLSPEEQARVKSIQGDPSDSIGKKVSIDPNGEKDTGDADKPEAPRDEKPAAGVGE
ncbi:MAG TPA: hypothetical protein VGO04_09270 [Ensifer sp.]|jgi:hypothetical protein|uniref:hypothetical protein n=1 Tax=Ensifer sp. TaxID=1872086 RepID=UPI002E0D860F|nr:hypothetical protein [Ensifer sp.]